MSVQKSARKPTWLEVGISNAGLIKGTTAIAWAWCWGIVREAIGHEPTVEEVAEWWNQSIRTAYRDQSAFKTAFPELDSPAPFVDQAEILPLVKNASRKMVKFANDREARKRPADLAVMKIGFLPCAYPMSK